MAATVDLTDQFIPSVDLASRTFANETSKFGQHVDRFGSHVQSFGNTTERAGSIELEAAREQNEAARLMKRSINNFAAADLRPRE